MERINVAGRRPHPYGRSPLWAEGFSLPNEVNPYFPTGRSGLPYADMIGGSIWLGLNEVEGLTIKEELLNESLEK